MYGIISIEEALEKKDVLFIDVRSQGEFSEDHIPNAINLPLFNDQERAELGKIYKDKGLAQARHLGLKIVSPKLPELYEKMLPYQDKKIVLYCWRGGMRSKTLNTIFSLMGLKCHRLEGGYKAYRRFVNAYFEKNLAYEIVVLHGLTGVGKTELIKILKEKNVNTVDLEALANNRGSSYGSIALSSQPTQKFFETQLFSQLWSVKDKKYVIMECESKRIGKVFLPDVIFQGMKKGKHILVYDTISNRIKRIILEYARHCQKKEVIEELLQSTKNLQQKLGKKTVEELQQLIIDNNLQPVVEYLLINYYDPLYKYPDHPTDEYDLSVNNECMDKASQEIIDFLMTNY